MECVGFIQEFSVGDNRSEIVPKVMGNGAGGACKGRDALRFDSLLLQDEQLAAHQGEGGAELDQLGLPVGSME